jgi:glycosyltransferase involved in cell wall biosynthesis
LVQATASDVATVILARNEERTIGEAVTGARRHCARVVVMDGHSGDATVTLAREAGAEVHLDPGTGKGAAIRVSLTVVSEPVVVFMDADGSHDPGDIPRLAAPVLDGRTDLCIGSRFTGGSEELSITIGQLVRTIGNISMNIAINKRWGVELTDTLNGFRAARREAVLQVGLREDIHTIEQEMVMKLLRAGYRVMNIPTHEYPRRFGESHIRIWRQWPRFVWCVVHHVVSRSVSAPVSGPFEQERTS